MTRTKPNPRLAWALVVLMFAPCVWADELVVADFEDATTGSYNPRGGWHAFGNGTTDRGVHADGSMGQGAYHAVNWAQATWGIGNISTDELDLSEYEGLRIDARLTPLAGYSGTATLELALDLPGGTEYATPAVALASNYDTYEFAFDDLERIAGSGTLDLSIGRPKFLLRRNGQMGVCQFDFDEIRAYDTNGGGVFDLTAVVLNPPWDGDSIRAMWLYAGGGNLRVDSAADCQEILDFCAREGVNRIYFGGYAIWALGGDELRDNLRVFLEASHASGIRVEALLDGIDWHEHPDLVRNRIDQVLAIHTATPGNMQDDFDAIHFDVEFWLDDSWGGNEVQRQQVARAYFDNVLVNARDWLDAEGAGHLEIGIDLSTHMETSGMLPSPLAYGGTTRHFIEHAFDLVDDVVLMSYYDTVTSLATTTLFEIDRAAGMGRTIQLGADIQTGELPINTFADNAPTPYASMTQVLQEFHANLSTSRRAALDGFSVFHYDGYHAEAPVVRLKADLDGDEDVDGQDAALLFGYLTGPGALVDGPQRDADFDLSGGVDLADIAQFGRCFTGSGGEATSIDCMR